jgi:dTDP-4-dehydrorhamnose reductase
VRIFVTGVTGFVGSHVAEHLRTEHQILGTSFRSTKIPRVPFERVDLTDEKSVTLLITDFQPQVIVHLAAMSRVIECEDHPDDSECVNVMATAHLARLAHRVHAKLIFVSTDQVFSGNKGGYRESEDPAPAGKYGLTKLLAEHIVLSSEAKSLIIRSNSVVGASIGFGESFSDRVLRASQRKVSAELFQDQYRSPIHVRVLTKVIEAACVREINGLLHVGGPKRTSRLDTGFAVLRAYGLSADFIQPVSYHTHPRSSIMTADTSYDISRLKQVMPFLHFRQMEDEFIEDAKLQGNTI